MSTIQIQNRSVGTGHPVFVIAEIGVNHDGSLERALELVSHAKRAGADAVKLQVFSATTLMHPSAGFAEYQSATVDDSSPSAMLKRYELPPAELCAVVEAIRAAGMIALATPFSPADVDVIDALDLGAIKIASPDVVNRVLLERAVRSGKPLLISTGASEMTEVADAVDWLDAHDATFALLHCVSSYPTIPDDAHIGWIRELEQFCVPVGFSDHTTEHISGALAVGAGACVIEKHLTYDRSAGGPDHSASADPAQFAGYVRLIRLAEALRGAPGKCVLPVEADVRQVSRQSLVVARDIAEGTPIDATDLTAQRPGTGIPAGQVTVAIGRKALRALRAGTLLRWDMLSDAA